MTQPVDPTDRFLERMRLVSQEAFGTKYRPGLARTFAESDAPIGDLMRIGAMIRGIDTQRRVRLMQQSGAVRATTGAENDLLDGIGAGDEKIVDKPKQITITDALKQSANEGGTSWWEKWGLWAADKAFGGMDAEDVKDGLQVDEAMRGVSGIAAATTMQALDEVGKVPGFAYRAVRTSAGGYDDDLKREQMALLGYDPKSSWDEIAFGWNHGESYYGSDLTDLKDKYGADTVALAMSTFNQGSDLRDYAVDLEVKIADAYNAGDQTEFTRLTEQYKKINSPEFKDAYDAVDRRHSSPGRDLARAILPSGEWEDGKTFTAISGATDGLFTFFVDPTIVGGKYTKSVQLARWGVDSVDASKIYHMLGEADELGRLPVKKYYLPENNARRAGVEKFLNSATYYRDAVANGDHVEAAAIYAAASKAHPDLMPVWSQVNGIRPAVTEAERELARTQGHRFVDANGVESPYGAIKTKPIETVREFADYAANQWGLLRLQNGLAANPKALMPGKMGYKAIKRAGKAMDATRKGLTGHEYAFDFAGKNLDEIIGSDAEDVLFKAAEARGKELFDEANQWKNLADRIRVKSAAAVRRISTTLPHTRELNYHSAAAAKDVRRWARVYFPKAEAELFAAMWEQGSASTRRTLAHAMLRQTFEAAGLTRSTVGREYMEQFANEVNRRYGLGDSDLIAEGYKGARRAGMYPLQMEEGFVLPKFSEVRRAAAKAAVLGYDTELSNFGATAAHLKQYAKGKMGLSALRYMLFSSTGASRFMGAVKLGWIMTPANMTRNLLDEYGGLKLFSNNHSLSPARGRQTMRDAGLHNELNEGTALTRKWVTLTNHQIPRSLRMGIRNLRDATLAVNRGKLQMMGKDAEWRVEFAKELHESTEQVELAEYLGGRMVDNPDETLTLGREIAQDMINSGLPPEAWEFKGYNLLPVDGGAGLKALSSMYGQRFSAPRFLGKIKPEHRDEILEWANARQERQWKQTIGDLRDEGKADEADALEATPPTPKERITKRDGEAWQAENGTNPFYYVNVPESPANGVLAYLMWHEAAKDPEFMAALDDDTLWLMDELMPVGWNNELGDVQLSTMLRDAPYRKYDKHGDLDHDFQVKQRGKRLVLVERKHVDSVKEVRTEKPLEFIYRVVSADDYARMREEGVINTHGNMSHGRRADGKGQLFGAVEPERIMYLFSDFDADSVLLKIRYDAKDRWAPEMTDGDPAFVSTYEDIPFDRLHSAAKFVNRFDEATEKSYRESPLPGLPTEEALIDHLRDPRFSELRQQSEHYFHDDAGNLIKPDDAEGLDLAVRRMGPKYLTDLTEAVTRKDGKSLNPELASALLRGDIPTVQELQKIGLDNLPSHAVQPQYAVKTGGAVNWVLNGYTKALTRGYDYMVTRPIRAMLRSPMYVDAYTTARALTQRFADDMVENHGWAREIAQAEAKKLAEKHALNEVIKYVDNPKIASQFSAMNTNWWSFYRAQEDWLRRYGRALKADPTAIRKAQLAVYGAEQAGILDRDEDGNLVLTYPGSGAIVEAFLHVGAFLGHKDQAMVPDVADLTTRLTFMNPSLSNPFQYSSTPLVSIPYKVITSLTPGGELLDSVGDRALNGELGAGRTWYEQLLPTPILRASQVWLDDEANTGSVVGGATATAMVNMALSGNLDKYADTSTDRAKLIADIQTQSKNTLITRMVMAFFLPGAPGMPEMGEGDVVTEADFAYQQAGIQSLKAEYRQMLARMGPGPALALWTELHPEASILADSAKTETAPGAFGTVTLPAAKFVMDNKEFFTGEYASIAPYFMHEEEGQFSQIAWNALLQLQVRQHKDLDKFFVDLVTGQAVSEYYDKQDKSDAAIAEARMSGDKVRVAELQAEWDAEKIRLDEKYPTLDDWRAQGSERTRERQDRLETLERLVADPNIPPRIAPQARGIARMLQVHANFEFANAQLKDQRSARATAERQNLRVQYHDAMKVIVEDYPTLNDAYNGIFRPLVQE